MYSRLFNIWESPTRGDCFRFITELFMSAYMCRDCLKVFWNKLATFSLVNQHLVKFVSLLILDEERWKHEVKELSRAC